MSRLRFIPFFLGKIDAIRSARDIHARRKLRADLARSSIAPAHFPLRLGSLGDVLNHLRRPREHSARKPDMTFETKGDSRTRCEQEHGTT